MIEVEMFTELLITLGPLVIITFGHLGFQLPSNIKTMFDILFAMAVYSKSEIYVYIPKTSFCLDSINVTVD